MVSFASTQDMADRSEGEITADSHPFLQRELDAATAAIQDACGWHIAPVETKRLVRLRRFPGVVFIPASQIVSVQDVLLNGVEYATEEVEFDPLTGETNLYARSVDLYFTAGFAAVPPVLQTLTLELAAAGLGTALGVTREQAGAVALTYARTGGISADDDARLAPYRLVAIP